MSTASNSPTATSAARRTVSVNPDFLSAPKAFGLNPELEAPPKLGDELIAGLASPLAPVSAPVNNGARSNSPATPSQPLPSSALRPVTLILGTAQADTLQGTSGSDVMFGFGGDDLLEGNDGDDFIWGGQGNDTLRGGNGNDSLWGGSGNDKMYGGNGDDRLWGGSGNDEIYGGSGSDRIVGGSGNNKLYGEAGDDTFIGGAGNDLIDGGEGKDAIDYRRLDTAITYFANAQIVEVLLPAGPTATVRILKPALDFRVRKAGSTDTVSNIEILKGAAGQANHIDFSAGLSATYSNFYTVRPVPVLSFAPQIKADLQAKSLVYSDQTIRVENFTQVTGSWFQDEIRGDASDNILSAGSGFLAGDILDGRGGNDLLIAADLGGTTMTGGSGADTFRIRNTMPNLYKDPRDPSPRVFQSNTITDFQSGEDRIEIVRDHFTELQDLPLGQLSSATAGSYLVYDQNTGLINLKNLSRTDFPALARLDNAPSFSLHDVYLV